MISAIFVGMSRLLAWCRGFAQPVAVLAFCALMAKAALMEVGEFQYAPWRQEIQIKPFIELTRLKEKSGSAPICIRTTSWFNQCWALFFLQGYKVEVPNPLLFLKNFYATIKGARTEQSDEAVVLTDKDRPQAIWRNEIFSLLQRIGPVEVMAIDAPNSVESIEGNTFIWLDNRFAELTIHSDADRQAVLEIGECWPGPSRPGDKNRTLVISVNGAKTEIETSPNLKISLGLKKGDNLVGLSCKERPTVDKLVSGETRILLLGIKGLTVRAEN